MSIADEWKDWVRQREIWHSEEELEWEVRGIRQLEADFAEAMQLLSDITFDGHRDPEKLREIRAFVTRIDARKP